jgi:hypothetical protein
VIVGPPTVGVGPFAGPRGGAGTRSLPPAHVFHVERLLAGRTGCSPLTGRVHGVPRGTRAPRRGASAGVRGGPSTHPSALPAVPVARPFRSTWRAPRGSRRLLRGTSRAGPCLLGRPGRLHGLRCCRGRSGRRPDEPRSARRASRRSSPDGSTHGGWWRRTRAQRHPDSGSRTERLQVTAPRSGRSHGTGARPRGRDHVVAEVRYLRPPPCSQPPRRAFSAHPRPLRHADGGMVDPTPHHEQRSARI